MKWEKLEGTRQLDDHRREDGWTVHLKDDRPPIWIVCSGDGTRIKTKNWVPSEPIDDVLTWADSAIAEYQPKNF